MAAKDKVKEIKKKATNKLKEVGNAAQENPKAVINVVGGLLLLGGALYLLTKIKKTADGLFDGDQDIADQIDLNLDVQNATLTNQQAQNLASQLLDAMNAKQPFWGTDEKTVEAVFDLMKNGNDFKIVAQKFGLKDYNGYNSPPLGWFSNLDSYEERNLLYWLAREINPSDGVVYQKVKNRIESAGFAFS
jgi:hypothetical protein